ncbi:MAG: ASCH domain-containing protein [Pseudoclavibacter sp.]|nr:ASCH domain-containing protein [Pseudoclavibacter sp.]
MDVEALPAGEYLLPGPGRDRLVAAVRAGRKTATTALAADYERCGEPWPRRGDLEAVVDSAGRRVAITRVVAVESCRLAEVDDAHVRAEGEGFADLASWRQAHEAFWRQVLPDLEIDDDTIVVCVRFELVELVG